MHKGALKQVSPEEITAAYILAIARDVAKQEGEDIMEEWAKYLRSSTCNFVVLDSDKEMYWYAVEQREALEQTYKVARLSCYQRLHEIVRLMERMRQTMKETDVTAKRVADEYKANVASMTENSGSSVTNSFVDTASTVAKRMLSVPEIAFCMADLDEHYVASVPGSEFYNPFDSHSRLQAILDKRKMVNLPWGLSLRKTVPVHHGLAPSLLPEPLDHCRPSTLIRRLTLLVERAWAKILLERSREEELVQRSQWSSTKPSVGSWYGLAWRCWRKAKMIFHNPCVLDPDGIAATNIDEELGLLRDHWCAALSQPEPTSEGLEACLLDLVPFFSWDEIRLTRESFLSGFESLPSTHPGDDGRPYCAYAPLKELIADAFICMVDSMRSGDRLPANWYSALMVFKPKSREPGLFAHQWRPISMLPCISKLFASVIGRCMTGMLARELHSAQHGGLASRGVPSAIAEIEFSTLALGSHSRESMLLLLDVKSAFSSISQSWLLKVLARSGCHGFLLYYFEALMQPYEVTLVWRRGRYQGFWVSQGLLQGHPLSAILYLIGVDPWLRMLQRSLAPPATIAAYVDDLQISLASFEALLEISPSLALAKDVMNLELAWPKCKLIPLGPRIEALESRLALDLPQGSPLGSIEVCDGARTLGFYFGRGDSWPDKVALNNLRSHLPLLGDRPLGAAMNLMLLRACILSSVSHILRICSPSPELERVWQNTTDKLATVPRKWLREFLPHAKALFNLPCAVLPLQLVHGSLVMSYLFSSGIDVLARWESLEAHWSIGESLLLHPLWGLQQRGLWATWVSIWKRAHDLNFVQRRPLHAPRWMSWKLIRKELHRCHIGTPEFVLSRLEARIKIHNSILLPQQRRLLESGLLRQVCRRLSLVSPNATIALLRFFVGGWGSSRHRFHQGDCCWCHGWHLIHHHSALLLQGCFIPLMAQVSGWRWLSSHMRSGVFGLMQLSVSDWSETRRLASLIRFLAKRKWACVHARSPLPGIADDAKQWLAARPRP